MEVVKIDERKYYKKIVGDKLYLSPISYDDVEQYTEMVNNTELMVGLGSIVYTNIIDVEKEKENLDFFKKQKYQFAVRRIEDDELVGNVGFNHIDELHRTAVLGIMLANDKYQNMGYGTEAMNLLLDFGFSFLNLKNISLACFEYNTIAYNLYKKVGFKEVGRIRKSIEFMGKRYDDILMDILPEEFECKYIKRNLGRYNLK